MKLLSRIKREIKLKQWQENIDKTNETILGPNFCIRKMVNRIDKLVKVGEKTSVDACFIFEKNSGHVVIGDRCHIGCSTFISIDGIEIGNDVTIAWDCLFYDHNSHSLDWEKRQADILDEYRGYQETGNMMQYKDWTDVVSKPIVIKDKVWIGMGATIMKGVTIGEGAVVAARSVVVKDVEPYTVVGGNPARVIKRISANSDIEGKM